MESRVPFPFFKVTSTMSAVDDFTARRVWRHSFKADADVRSTGRKQPESEWVLTRNQLIGFSSSSLSAGYQFFDAEPRRTCDQ